MELTTSAQDARAGQVTATSARAPRQVPKEATDVALSPGMKTPLAQGRPERFGMAVVSLWHWIGRRAMPIEIVE